MPRKKKVPLNLNPDVMYGAIDPSYNGCTAVVMTKNELIELRRLLNKFAKSRRNMVASIYYNIADPVNKIQFSYFQILLKAPEELK